MTVAVDRNVSREAASQRKRNIGKWFGDFKVYHKYNE